MLILKNTVFNTVVLKFLSLSLFLLSQSGKANDGVFYASGGNLIPLHETKIALSKEVLKFYVKDFNNLYVDVYFEFYNPDEEKKLIIGFVTPPANGDISEFEEQHPNINNFTVLVNNQKLRFKVKQLKETSFKTDMSINAVDYVYYFEVFFKKGLNIIKHTYNYKASSSIEIYREFNYQLTTGKRWANKRIDNFELQIHLDNGIFYIPSSLNKINKKLEWKIKGSGVFKQGTEKPFIDYGTIPYKFIHLNSGYVYFNETNFAPDYDFNFGENAWHSYSYKWCNNSDSCSANKLLSKIAPYCNLKPDYEMSQNTLDDFTGNELKLLKNYFYALRGYKFKTKIIFDFYSNFFWYVPIEALTENAIKLSASEQEFIKKISDYEKFKSKK
ncbi:MAG: YARHG domain-containing protein [Bacteroidia bacterium]|nr:YARHG domain-containing protein [Bacteroidia bacterium]